jgi:ABC-type lipoprotein release transport system permease subunit
MERTNTHKLDETTSTNLMDMLNSPDESSVALGIEILRNIDLNDTDTIKLMPEMTKNISLKRRNLDQMEEIINVFGYYLELDEIKTIYNS